jgi:hypothetical protein
MTTADHGHSATQGALLIFPLASHNSQCSQLATRPLRLQGLATGGRESWEHWELGSWEKHAVGREA